MPPLAITILTLLAKYGPAVLSNIMSIVRKPEATDADWDALFKEIAALDYDRAIHDAEQRSSGGVV